MFFIIMGVSGCGKTSVGEKLAEELGWDFYDADNFHSPANVSKMAKGIPLNDDDRVAWLEALRDLISSCLRMKMPGVLACSALKESYRQKIIDGNTEIKLIYLKGSYELIWSRMQQREGHYMKPEMLKSQFDTLQEPENALVVDISMPVERIVKLILEECA